MQDDQLDFVGKRQRRSGAARRFALTLGVRLSEPGLRSANEVYGPTGTYLQC